MYLWSPEHQSLIRKVVGLYQIDRTQSCVRLGKRLQLSVSVICRCTGDTRHHERRL